MAKGRDPRLTPARPDIAASFLKGQVSAERYVDGTPHQVSLGVSAVRSMPQHDAPQETQCLFGEVFTVYEELDGWAWGQARRDGYVGYVDVDTLSRTVSEPTHRVSALRAYWYSKPDLKSAPLEMLSMNAKLTITGETGDYLRLSRGGYIWKGAVIPIDQTAEDDAVSVAALFLHAPYYWGGKESLGLDCSGLLQNAFEAVGVAIPRDADQQEAHFADPSRGQVLWSDADSSDWQSLELQRGDLLFWPGHTGMMVDDQSMIHANATYMATTINDLREIAETWERDKDLRMRQIIRPRISR